MTKTKTRRLAKGAKNKYNARMRAQKAAVRARAAKRAGITPGALPLEEARIYLGGIARPTLYRLVKRGLLRPSRGTRILMFPVFELDRYLRDTTTEAEVAE